MQDSLVVYCNALSVAGTGSASVKDSVKAALGQKATITWGTSGSGQSQEARVQFWVRPGLEDPTVQERLQYAWAAVLSPTGEDNTPFTACKHIIIITTMLIILMIVTIVFTGVQPIARYLPGMS